MAKGGTLRGRHGFTLLEIMVVLVLLGLLAAVAVPKYMSLAEGGRVRAAQGQVAEAKGRLKALLGNYLLDNRGVPPLDGLDLMDYVALHAPASCPTLPGVEGEFEFQCLGDFGATSVTVTVTAVQGQPLAAAVSGSFSF